MSNETNATIDAIMGDVKSFARTLALVGTSPDDGSMYATAKDRYAALRTAIAAALDSQARKIEALTAERDELRAANAALHAQVADWHRKAVEMREERDELRKRLDDATPATPATPAPGEWIEWRGGECPIADGVKFEFRFRDGTPTHCTTYNNAPAWNWSNRDHDGDITTYRVM